MNKETKAILDDTSPRSCGYAWIEYSSDLLMYRSGDPMAVSDNEWDRLQAAHHEGWRAASKIYEAQSALIERLVEVLSLPNVAISGVHTHACKGWRPSHNPDECTCGAREIQIEIDAALAEAMQLKALVSPPLAGTKKGG
jgi:hypothetical protein